MGSLQVTWSRGAAAGVFRRMGYGVGAGGGYSPGLGFGSILFKPWSLVLIGLLDQACWSDTAPTSSYWVHWSTMKRQYWLR